jgi:hypothetical protein
MELIGELERGFAALIYPNRVAVALLVIVAVVGLALVARRRRWDRAVRRHPRVALGALVVVLAIGLPLGWYLGSPLFLSTTVDEPAPVVAAAPTEAPAASEAPAAPATPGVEPSAATPAPSAAAAERTGSFVGADEFHFGEGTARLIETAPGTFTVRLEDFAVRNGPDLFVYLSPSPDGYAKGAVELGRLKADRGNQNYAVPAGTDVSGAASVVIWCREFSVLFATAPLG